MAKACTDGLVALIESLHLGEGDRLPGERELARHLGFSRTTIRESLIAMSAQGHLEIRGRSGCYVSTCTAPAPVPAADAMAALDALAAIGPHLAARAAQRCSAEHARRLETVTARLGRFLVNRDAPQTAREVITFFVVLATVAGNPYLSRPIKEIAQARPFPARPVAMEKAAVESFFALHVSLLQAVQNRDPRHAVPLATHCLDAFATLMGGSAGS
jgi:DNA-binding FadR family transcriptional regulator